MKTFELMNYFENLRRKRNITQETFLHEIVSIRQYQRYRNATSIVPLEVISKMADRLGIDNRKILKDFEEKKVIEKESADHLYNLIVQGNLEEASTLILESEDKIFLQAENKKLFDISKALFEFEMKRISKYHFIDRLFTIIDYTNVLRVNVVTEVELLALGLIYLKSEEHRKQVVSKFIEIYSNNGTSILGNSLYTDIQVLFWIAKYLGSNNEFKLVKSYCHKAIDLLHANHSNYHLDYFYYYLAMAHYYLEEKTEYNYNLQKCILVVSLKESEEYKSKMISKLERNFNIEVNNDMVYYKNVEVK